MELTEAIAAELGLVSRDGGWEPESGRRLKIVLGRRSSAAMSLEPVTRIITTGDTWLVRISEGEETVCLDPRAVVMLVSERRDLDHRGDRTGFA